MRKTKQQKNQDREFKEYLRELFPEGSLTKIRQWAGKLNLAIRQRNIEGVIDLETLAKLVMGDVYKQSSAGAKKEHLLTMMKAVRTLSTISAEISAATPNHGYCIVPAPAEMARVPLGSLKRMSKETILSTYYTPGWKTTHAFISFSSNGNVEEAREESRIRIANGATAKSRKRIKGWANAGLIADTKVVPKIAA